MHGPWGASGKGRVESCVGGAGAGVVVHDDQNPVACAADIEFPQVGTVVVGEAGRRKGVLGGVRPCTTVGDDQRALPGR